MSMGITQNSGNVSHHHSTHKEAFPITEKRGLARVICLQSLLPGAVIYSLADPRIDAELPWVRFLIHGTRGLGGDMCTSKYKTQVSLTTFPRFKGLILL